jgi:hypothetical protein
MERGQYRNWQEFYSILDRSLPRFNETLQLPFDDSKAMQALLKIEPQQADFIRRRV